MSNVSTHSDFVVVSIMKTFNSSDLYRGATIYYQKAPPYEENTISFLANSEIAAEDVDSLDRFEANVIPRIEDAIEISAGITTSNSAISIKSYNTLGVEES